MVIGLKWVWIFWIMSGCILKNIVESKVVKFFNSCLLILNEKILFIFNKVELKIVINILSRNWWLKVWFKVNYVFKIVNIGIKLWSRVEWVIFVIFKEKV